MLMEPCGTHHPRPAAGVPGPSCSWDWHSVQGQGEPGFREVTLRGLDRPSTPVLAPPAGSSLLLATLTGWTWSPRPGVCSDRSAWTSRSNSSTPSSHSRTLNSRHRPENAGPGCGGWRGAGRASRSIKTQEGGLWDGRFASRSVLSRVSPRPPPGTSCSGREEEGALLWRETLRIRKQHGQDLNANLGGTGGSHSKPEAAWTLNWGRPVELVPRQSCSVGSLGV